MRKERQERKGLKDIKDTKALKGQQVIVIPGNIAEVLMKLKLIKNVEGYGRLSRFKIDYINNAVTFRQLVDFVNHENDPPPGYATYTSYFGDTLYQINNDESIFFSKFDHSLLQTYNYDYEIFVVYFGYKYYDMPYSIFPTIYPLFRWSSGNKLALLVSQLHAGMVPCAFWPVKHRQQIIDESTIVVISDDIVVDTSLFDIEVIQSSTFQGVAQLLLSQLQTIDLTVTNVFSQDNYWDIQITVKDTDETMASFPCELHIEGVNCNPEINRIEVTGSDTIKVYPPPTIRSGLPLKIKVGGRYFASIAELGLTI